jgi:hypothetical protein
MTHRRSRTCRGAASGEQWRCACGASRDARTRSNTLPLRKRTADGAHARSLHASTNQIAGRNDSHKFHKGTCVGPRAHHVCAGRESLFGQTSDRRCHKDKEALPQQTMVPRPQEQEVGWDFRRQTLQRQPSRQLSLRRQRRRRPMQTIEGVASLATMLRHLGRTGLMVSGSGR